MRGRLLIGLIVIGVVLVTWFVVRAVETQRFGNELLRARRDFGAGRFETARKNLAQLARGRPGEGEVEYLLGACEMVKSHADAAMAAWARVPDSSPFAPAAGLARGRRALDVGRYRLAETCLERASRGGGEIGQEAGRLLEWLYWMTGRRDDYKRLLHRNVERAIDPSPLLRTLWAADHDPYPVNGMTRSLAKARESAPDDDRVWLGLADLATRNGRYQEAGSWLDRCEQAQPDDSSVWLARLRWAEAAGRSDEVSRAATHLPGSSVPWSRILALRAKLAAHKGDTQGERAVPRRARCCATGGR